MAPVGPRAGNPRRALKSAHPFALDTAAPPATFASMSRIASTFAALRARRARALVPYLTAGFPTSAHTVPLLHALVRGGADVIELGVPFSDPIADGPTIQRASVESLKNGTSLAGILQSVREFRLTDTATPIVLFGAYNPFLRYGFDKLPADAAAAGVDGLLIADLPADEAPEILPAVRAAGLDLIHLIAPTTPAARKAEIAATASGFIYYISLKGVTGARTDLTADLAVPMAEIRAATDLPVAVGFGISTPAQAATVGALADGVVVGSALIDLIFKNADGGELESLVEKFMSDMKAALSTG